MEVCAWQTEQRGKQAHSLFPLSLIFRWDTTGERDQVQDRRPNVLSEAWGWNTAIFLKLWDGTKNFLIENTGPNPEDRTGDFVIRSLTCSLDQRATKKIIRIFSEKSLAETPKY